MKSMNVMDQGPLRQLAEVINNRETYAEEALAAAKTEAALEKTRQKRRDSMDFKASLMRKRSKPPPPPPPKLVVTINENGITLEDLAKQLRKEKKSISKFFSESQIMDKLLPAEVALEYATGLGVEVEIEESTVDEKDAHQPRAPVVAIMGHVDHGKTSLLDRMRGSDVAAKEAGAITQKVAAFSIDLKTGEVLPSLPVFPADDRDSWPTVHPAATFIDTPGHEAFTAMRKHSAGVMHMVVLVVAAPRGIQDQTIESIKLQQSLGTPVIVALNKCDLVDESDLETIKEKLGHELSTHGIITEETGGDVQVVPTSAVTGDGLQELYDAITLQTEMLELKGNPSNLGRAVAISCVKNPRDGIATTCIVQSGTVNVGDYAVAGQQWCRIKALKSSDGQFVQNAPMSSPVTVLGFNDIVPTSCAVKIVNDGDIAKQVCELRIRKAADEEMEALRKKQKQEAREANADEEDGEEKEEIPTLPIVVKADEESALQCFVDAIEQLPSQLIKPEIISKSVGAVSDSDLFKAECFKACVVQFAPQKPSQQIARKAAQMQVQLLNNDVLHVAVDQIGVLMSENLPMKKQMRTVGVARVLKAIPLHKKKRNVYFVAGCKAVEGVIKKSGLLHLIRDGELIHECNGAITMKHLKDDVDQIERGSEFAIHLSGDPPPEYVEGDEIHHVQPEMKKQSIFDYQNFR